MLVAVWVTATAERKLVGATFALLADPAEVFGVHVGRVDDGSALVAADARELAEATLAVGTVAHHAHIDEVRERCHERVDACVAALVVEDARTHVGACLGIEGRDETIFGVNDSVAHGLRSVLSNEQCHAVIDIRLSIRKANATVNLYETHLSTGIVQSFGRDQAADMKLPVKLISG